MKISTRNAREVIRDQRVFKTHGALYATRPVGGFKITRTGDLPMEFCDSVRDATYVVYSYATPIAWVTPDGKWVRPAVKYSVTTSRHQGQCPLDGTDA